jgi:hypothetical protein
MPETYCRKCGVFLPDLSKPFKPEAPPEQHLKANTVLSILTIVVCAGMATLLYAMLGFRPGTHPLIYVAAGMFIAIGAWHIQTLIRTLKLKKQFKKKIPPAEAETVLVENQPAFEARTTSRLLDRADPADAIPASVTENTTRHLGEKIRR